MREKNGAIVCHRANLQPFALLIISSSLIILATGCGSAWENYPMPIPCPFTRSPMHPHEQGMAALPRRVETIAFKSTARPWEVHRISHCFPSMWPLLPPTGMSIVFVGIQRMAPCWHPREMTEAFESGTIELQILRLSRSLPRY